MKKCVDCGNEEGWLLIVAIGSVVFKWSLAIIRVAWQLEKNRNVGEKKSLATFESSKNKKNAFKFFQNFDLNSKN